MDSLSHTSHAGLPAVDPPPGFELPPLRALLLIAGLTLALVLSGTPVVHAATLEGTIVARHSDDFSGRQSDYRYFLDRSRGATLELDGVDARRMEPGSMVAVDGERDGNTVQVSDVDTLRSATARASGAHKVAVVLFNFTNDTSEPWTPAEVKQRVFTDSDSVNEYFKEESTGQLSLEGQTDPAGDVLGWYHLNVDNSGCKFEDWATAAEQEVIDGGGSLDGYDNVVYMFPDAASCNWAGLAYLPGSAAFINGTDSLRVISHELSHNFNVHHASSYRCTTGGTRVFMSSSCTQSEYGDPFTVMGGGATYHSHALAKVQLGFLPSSTIATVTTPGTYSISDSEQLQPGAFQLLRYPRARATNGSVTQYYYVDFRQPFGNFFESFSPSAPIVNGVSIRLAPSWPARVQALLLDGNPATNTFTDAPLQVGQSATDPTTGVTFETLSASSSSAQVRISQAPPQAAPPSTPAQTPTTQPEAQLLNVAFTANTKRTLKTRRLIVNAACDRFCAVSAAATAKLGGRSYTLTGDSATAATGGHVRLTLKWSRKAARAASKALKRGRAVTVKLTLNARAHDGTSRSATKRVRIG